MNVCTRIAFYKTVTTRKEAAPRGAFMPGSVI